MPVPTGVVDESSPPVAPWIWPPEQPIVLAFVHVPPLPVTINPPLAPVESSLIPFEPPFAEMLRKLTFDEPIVVPVAVRAVPVPVVSVLVDPVMLTVPPLVAV